MKIIKIILLVYLLFSVVSCGTVKKAFTNEKKKGTDEFLVEKKSPLVMPPNYKDLPLPKSEEKRNDTSNEIKSLLSEVDNKTISEELNTNFEKSILEKIKDK